jgi:hypothetical protein
MNLDLVYTVCFSDSFVTSWRDALHHIFMYKTYYDFVIVPTILGNKTYSYLPLLNYTDKTIESIENSIRVVSTYSYQARVLNPNYRSFVKDDTVVMRIPLLGRNSDEVWKSTLPTNMKKQLKKSFKNNFLLKNGNDRDLILDFYRLFSLTMKKFGTPVFGLDLFLKIPTFMNSKYYVVYFNNKPIAGMLLLFDEQIVWCPYSGSDESYTELRPGHFMFWNGIKDACDQSKLLFDFGRSAFGNNNYFFKERWGAIPVKVDILAPNKLNIYKKYKLAGNIYKRLPNCITNNLGPVLCKRLPDL